ncbi:hypothetical protein ACJIZ3_011578 [Penstemon smallii]|uniref:BRCT domain-containing protein n=1 Tax=Penstemon smallii TaxID=265156 RepID=A0ABD3UJG5_9LAMI
MLENKQVLAYDDPSKTFTGVRYVLFGFDSTNKEKIQSKLLEGGGIDAVSYGPNCTHVIVHKLVYDDPVCVRAIRDGKILVTGLWVDHSFDAGMPVDPTSVMYRPMRDLNGIPGAKSLIVCLTGYMRQDRDDIMVLTATLCLLLIKAKHKIKYDLAKKMKKIKLVNHCWLEDCLKAWEILPETDYAKSGYELEMEAEAKDSEEETEDIASIIDVGRQNVASPQSARVENRISHQSPVKHEGSRNSILSSASKSLANIGGTSKVQSTPTRNEKDLEKTSFLGECHTRQLSSASKSLANTGETSKVQSTPRKKMDLENEPFLGDYHDRHHEMPRSPRNISSEVPSSMVDGTMMSEKVENAIASASEGAKKSPSAELSKLNRKSFSRSTPRKPSVSLSSERIENNSGKPSATNVNKVGASGGLKMPLETRLNGADFCGIKTPSKGTNFQLDEGHTVSLPDKKKMTLTLGSSKSPTVSHGLEKLIESESMVKTKELLGSDPSVDGSHKLARHTSPTINTHQSEEASLAPIESKKEASKQYKKGLKKRTLSTDLKSKDHSLSRTDNPTSEVEIQGIEPPFSMSGVEKSGEKADLSISSLQHVTDSNKPKRKLLAKKTLGSRPSLGKGSTTKNKGSINLQKAVLQNEDIIHSNGAVATKDIDSDIITEKVLTLTTGTDRSQTTHVNNLHEPQNEVNDEAKHVDDETNATDDKMETVSDGVTNKEKFTEVDEPHSGNISREKSVSANDTGKQSASKITGKKLKVAKSIDDKNDALAEEGLRSKEVEMIESKLTGDALEGKVSKGKKRPLTKTKTKIFKDPVEEAKRDESSTKAEEALQSKEVEMIESKSTCDALEKKITKGKKRRLTKTKTQILKDPVEEEAKGDESSTKAEEALQSKEVEMIESKSTGDALEEKKTKGKKRPLTKTKTKIFIDPVEEAIRDESSTKQDKKKTVVNDEGTVALAGKNKARPSKKLKSSSDAEKENKLVEIGNQSVSNDTIPAKKVALKKSTKNVLKVDKSNFAPVKTEPACFILSGHKLQRKEYQQVIKRLKGKVCRDSHNWSYQATHFIVPDPIRRTEKFFAAAASGSWILKTDYLTACDKAGHFLPEEPYEWHKKSLNEDGAINLEAPRKWRLLKERTGHGALYGMRIVIYGECIAPPLDTLKRVVKAGGGTILATSPPYTRFFPSEIDFAIVSPGMPRVDMWVQEFLSHEVPCVLADYLVEYICKPGYSLERHVQYNTHSWAEKSLKNLVNRLEEVLDEPRTPVVGDNIDDVACQVCESRDRGDEMLICGNESGTLGCGVGTHFNCLDPPLEDVPEEDWFCPSCSKKGESKIERKSSVKRSSKSKK